LSLLAGIDAFRDMNRSERDCLERPSTVLQPRDGSEIFSRGGPPDALSAIVGVTGHVRIPAADRGSKTLIVTVYRQGNIFGETEILDGGSARTATAIVEGSVRVARIWDSSFLAALSSSAGLSDRHFVRDGYKGEEEFVSIYGMILVPLPLRVFDEDD
jgi:CRP-like cAMP-binding protein